MEGFGCGYKYLIVVRSQAHLSELNSPIGSVRSCRSEYPLTFSTCEYGGSTLHFNQLCFLANTWHLTRSARSCLSYLRLLIKHFLRGT